MLKARFARVQFEDMDLLIITLPLSSVSAAENVLVGDLGLGAGGSSSMAHLQVRQVIPLTDAAARLFGGPYPRTIDKSIMQPLRQEELRP